MTRTEWIASCDDYLAKRTGRYNWRRIRYWYTVKALWQLGLRDEHTLMDIGAGWTEFDYCLRTEGNWRGRYIPVDGAMDGTDLNSWVSPRRAHFFVALEILEHLTQPGDLLRTMKTCCDIGICISTPNPAVVNVLEIDPTHQTPIHRSMLREWDFAVEEVSFFGKERDTLFGVWRA